MQGSERGNNRDKAWQAAAAPQENGVSGDSPPASRRVHDPNAEGPLGLQRRDGALIITIEREERRNALSQATLEAFGDNAFVSGTPIRSFDGIDRAAARHALGVDPDDRLLLVFGGSQAVARLNAAVFESLPRLVEGWHVLHLAGEAGMADAGAARQRLPEHLRPRYTAEPFLTDRMAEALVAADLVVGRAGSSTCAELAAVGVASVLVPYPFAGARWSGRGSRSNPAVSRSTCRTTASCRTLPATATTSRFGT